MPTPAEIGPVAWHISTRSSSGGGSCVEAGPLPNGTAVALRHSHHPTGPIHLYPTPAWHTFLTALKNGTFDL